MHINRRDFITVISAVALSGTIFYTLDHTVGLFKNRPGENIIGIFKKDIWHRAVCNLCPSKCGLIVRVIDKDIIKFEGNPRYPVNKGSLCPRAHVIVQLLHMKNRVMRPLRRSDGKLTYVKEEDMIRYLADALEKSRSVYLIGEEDGTAGEILNVFASKSKRQAIIRTKPFTYPKNLQKYNCILMVGADILNGYGHIMHNLKSYGMFKERRVRGKIIYLSPRKSITGLKTDKWIGIKPGTYNAFILGLISYMIDTGMYEEDMLKEVIINYKNVINLVKNKYNIDWAANVTGVNKNKILRLAEDLYENRPSIALAGNEVYYLNNSKQTLEAVTLLNILLGTNPAVPEIDDPFKHLIGYKDIKKIVSYNLHELIEEVINNSPSLIIFNNIDPYYEFPNPERFKEMKKLETYIICVSPFLRNFEYEVADFVVPLTTFVERWTDGLTILLDNKTLAYLTKPISTNIVGLPTIVLEILKEYYDFMYVSEWDAIQYRWQGIWEKQSGFVGNYRVSEFTSFDEFINSVLNHTYWISEVGRERRLEKVGVELEKWAEPITVGDGKFYLHPYQTTILDYRFGECPWIYQRPTALFPGEKFELWVEVNPDDASDLKLSDNDIIFIKGPSGKLIKCKVKKYDGIIRGVIGIPLGMGREIQKWGVIGNNPIELMSLRWKGKLYEKDPVLYATKVDVIR